MRSSAGIVAGVAAVLCTSAAADFVHSYIYASSDCTGTRIMDSGQFVSACALMPSGSGTNVYGKVVCSGASQYAMLLYTTSDCTGTPVSSTLQNVGTCEINDDGKMITSTRMYCESGTYSLPKLSGTGKYLKTLAGAACNDGSLGQSVTSAGCVSNNVNSSTISCAADKYTLSWYTGTSCAGKAFATETIPLGCIGGGSSGNTTAMCLTSSATSSAFSIFAVALLAILGFLMM